MNQGTSKIRFEPVGDIVSIFLRGCRWYANFQFGGQQQRKSLSTTSKKEARRRAIQIEADLVQGHFRRTPEPPNIEQAIQDYLAFLRTEGRAGKTLIKYEKILNRLVELAARCRARTVADIKLSIVDAYRSERVQAGIASKTLFTETVVIRQMVNFAVSRGQIAIDPLQGLRLKKPKPSPQPCWTEEQVELILQSAQEPERSKLAVLAGTGMRVGELKYLTWDDVDFTHNLLHVRPKNGWQPKTGDQRAIPMSIRVRTTLESLPHKSGWVFNAAPSAKFPKGDHQFSERHLLTSLKRVLAKLGLEGHIHTFRHAFISQALTLGIPEAIVRNWVGHVDAEVIKLYTHIADVPSQAAMRRLGGTQKHTPSGDIRNSEVTSGDRSAQNQPNEGDSHDA